VEKSVVYKCVDGIVGMWYCTVSFH